MKNLSRLLLAFVFVLGYNYADAQDKNNPTQITIGINAVDAFPSGDGAPFSETIFSKFFDTGNYSVLPSLSYLSISQYLGDGFSFGVTGSINQIEKWGEVPGTSDAIEVGDLSYYAADGIVKYNFLEGTTIDPYLGVGGGYTWIDEIGAGTLNGTAGVNFWLNDNLGLTVQTSYKHAFEDYLQTHFQHSVGISLKFGGTDTDGDGVYDKDDACPDVAGLEAFQGCPDTDGDGIEDSKDSCPNEAGLAELNGCPDTDGDGIADNKDKCPTVAGLKALDGCPDADGDGVTDADDKCPNTAGPAANNGCPWPDTDGDGVLDKDDKCPDVKGTVANNGCPEVTEEVQKTLNEYAKTINFDTGKSSIKDESAKVLADIIKILNEYPNSKFTVEGHTDSVGSEKLNQSLSESRAGSVKDYLTSHGVDQFRLSSKGYGESKPVASNKTRAGRAQNRRVEINLAK